MMRQVRSLKGLLIFNEGTDYEFQMSEQQQGSNRPASHLRYKERGTLTGGAYSASSIIDQTLIEDYDGDGREIELWIRWDGRMG